LSFRRFCGLPLEVETPDHASIWRFRQTIDKLCLSAALLAETNQQLDALGLIVKRGTLVDATLIAASVKRPSYGAKGVNPRDPDARVTMKRKTVHFGYKAHLAVDEESGLVRQAEMTSANVHDFCLAEALIQGDEQGYFADKAYSSQAFREALGRRGLIDGVAWRGRAPSSTRRLAEADQFLVVEHPLRRRARSRHDEAMVRHEPRPLSRACPQRLPSPVRRHRHEHETGARPHGAKLRDLSRPIRPQALHQASAQALRPQDARHPRRQPSLRPL
jgi:IS5 family transposase